MSSAIKSITFTICLFIFWMAIIYLGISFYKLELNVSKWELENRGVFIGVNVCYLIFSPLIFLGIKENIEK